MLAQGLSVSRQVRQAKKGQPAAHTHLHPARLPHHQDLPAGSVSHTWRAQAAAPGGGGFQVPSAGRRFRPGFPAPSPAAQAQQEALKLLLD